MPASLPAATPAEHIATLADQCVMCGLCLPSCPTYRVSRTEAESPRGRIAFARTLAAGADDVTLQTHLDQCLACRRCERVCPSGMAFGELLIETRTLLKTRTSARRGWLDRLVAKPARLRTAVRLGQALGAKHWLPTVIRRWAKPDSVLTRIAAEFPTLPTMTPLPAWTPGAGTGRGRVALLAGCVASAFDRDTLVAAIKLLSAAGYGVAVPPSQGCCGALARHAGRLDEARRIAAPTRSALLDSGTDTVLVTASGCIDTLRDFTLAGTRLRVREIDEFLAQNADVARLRFRALARRAALHVPCTLANATGADAATAALLARIPQLVVLPLSPQPGCCGAAGDYFLRHAAIADALRGETLDQVAALAPDLLLTSNIGCRLFLGNGLRRSGQSIEVLHPVTLLARQLEIESAP